jgi:transcription elongation GreA/GreB family factor
MSRALVRESDQDGRELTFRIVGEDQANLAERFLSWVSPLAKAAMGAVPEDMLSLLNRQAEVLRIEA